MQLKIQPRLACTLQHAILKIKSQYSPSDFGLNLFPVLAHSVSLCTAGERCKAKASGFKIHGGIKHKISLCIHTHTIIIPYAFVYYV